MSRLTLHSFQLPVQQQSSKANLSMCNELFYAQQEVITSFVESLEHEISANSQLTSLMSAVQSDSKFSTGVGRGNYIKGKRKCL